jgi:hypothetical protein
MFFHHFIDVEIPQPGSDPGSGRHNNYSHDAAEHNGWF